MQFAPLALLLATGVVSATELSLQTDQSNDGIVVALETTTQTTTLTVDVLITSTKTEHLSRQPLPITTICTQQCIVLTLSTLTKPASRSTSHVSSSPHISISCPTIYDTATDYSESSAPSYTSPLSAPISVVTGASSLDSGSTTLIAQGTQSVSTSLVVHTSKTVLTSLIVQSLSSVSTSEPCSTDVTVTKTVVETWWSKAPVTATLLRTKSLTIETAIVEAYSTSTGEETLMATRTTTATIHQVSLDTTCLGGKTCCGACATAGLSEPSVEKSGSGSIESPVSGDFQGQGTTVTSTALTTYVENTAVSTAGAAAVTAGVGLVGALVGFMAVLV
ncbi:hypothetical protein AK830_g8730 [Neonectria ditissima]|uniref:Uncharacterized protein n=1 Tax=Neonectria ditissima TaxID=78410 RepID=A0A0N8H630_9HYPO|nr:hypothetical protein AK830_g8730 [Neonectria ditissima]